MPFPSPFLSPKTLGSAWSAVILVGIAALCPAQTRPVPEAPAPGSGVARDYSREAWVVEKLSTSVVFEPEGAGRRESVAVVRVQSAEAVRQFGVLTIPYDTALEKIERLEVRVRKPDGTVVPTPAANVQDRFPAAGKHA